MIKPDGRIINRDGAKVLIPQWHHLVTEEKSR